MSATDVSIKNVQTSPTFKSLPNVLINLADNLTQKGYTFLLGEDYQDFLKQSREQSSKNLDRVGKFITGLLVPSEAFASDLLGKVMKKGFFQVLSMNLVIEEQEKFEKILSNLANQFDLTGLKYSSMGGLLCTSCLVCDTLSPNEIVSKARIFNDYTQELIPIGCRMRPKLLGIRYGRDVQLGGRGSLCLIFTQPEAYRKLSSTVSQIELKSDNWIQKGMESSMKSMVSVLFLASPPKGAIYREKITYCTFNNRIESNIKNRGWFQFGFSLNDLRK